MKKMSSLFCAIALSALLSSCLEYEFKLTFRTNNSAEVSANMLINSALVGLGGGDLASTIEESRESAKERGFQYETLQQNGMSGFRIWKPINDLYEAFNEGLANEVDFFGVTGNDSQSSWSATRYPDRTEYTIDQVFDLSSSDFTSAGGGYGDMLSGSLLESLKLVFVLDLPVSPVESNSTDIQRMGTLHSWKLVPGKINLIHAKIILYCGADIANLTRRGGFWNLLRFQNPAIPYAEIREPLPWGIQPSPWRKGDFPANISAATEEEQQIAWEFEVRTEAAITTSEYVPGAAPTDWMTNGNVLGWSAGNEKNVWDRYAAEPRLYTWSGKWENPDYINIYSKGSEIPVETWKPSVEKPGFFEQFGAEGRKTYWKKTVTGNVLRWTAYDSAGRNGAAYRVEKDLKGNVSAVQYWSDPATKVFDLSLTRNEKGIAVKGRSGSETLDMSFSATSVPSQLTVKNLSDSTEWRLEYQSDEQGRIKGMKEYKGKNQIAVYLLTRDGQGNLTKLLRQDIVSLYGENRVIDTVVSTRKLSYLKQGEKLAAIEAPKEIESWLKEEPPRVDEEDKPPEKIVVATDATWPPMEFIDGDGNLVGFDIDLLREIARAAGFEVEIRNTPWDGIFAGLDAGAYQAVASAVSITDDRRESMDFSEGYLNAGQVLVVRKDTVDVTSLADLAGASVGAQIGTSGAVEISKVDGVELQNYDDIDLMFEDLAYGTIEAVVADGTIAANYVLHKESFADLLMIVSDALTEEWLGIAFKKGDTRTSELFAEGLAKVKEDGTLEMLIETWLR